VVWSDEADFTAFHGRTARALWAYVYRATGRAADADDVVQDAFCRLLVADVEALDEEGRRRYLFRIASNLMTDRWRRAAREQSWLSQAEAPASHESPMSGDEVASTFHGLKPRERALLWLAYVEEEDHRHIADALGLARGSVKVLLSRARARLRDLLKSRGIMKGSHG